MGGAKAVCSRISAADDDDFLPRSLQLDTPPLVARRGYVQAKEVNFILVSETDLRKHMMAVSELLAKKIRVSFKMGLEPRFGDICVDKGRQFIHGVVESMVLKNYRMLFNVVRHSIRMNSAWSDTAHR